MGLDCFAAVGNTADGYTIMPESLFENNKLCSGICSGSNASFRGKVYNDYVEYVTGQTLYADIIPNKVVKIMADKLTKFIEHFKRYDNYAFEATEAVYGVNMSEAEMLADWFNVVADNDGVVLGWW